MLGGGAEVSMGFLEQLQPVFHRHLHDDDTQRGGRRTQSAVGLNSGTERKQNFTVAGGGVMVGMISICVYLS